MQPTFSFTQLGTLRESAEHISNLCRNSVAFDDANPAAVLSILSQAQKHLDRMTANVKAFGQTEPDADYQAEMDSRSVALIDTH